MTRLLAFLRRNWLSIVLAIVPPVAIWYYFERNVTALRVVVTADVPVVSVDSRYAGQLQVRFRDTLVTSLDLIDLRVENSGREPIASVDFEHPLGLLLPGRVPFAPVVTAAKPLSLRPNASVRSPDTIEVQPLLLNPGDAFDLRTFVVNRRHPDPGIRSFARIRGVRDVIVERAGSPRRANIFLLLTGTAAGLLSVLSTVRLVRDGFQLRQLSASMQRLVREPPTEPEAARRLGERLAIEGHDAKSNLMLLRLKLESVLQSIARLSGKLQEPLTYGISRLARLLASSQVIEPRLATTIMDLAPVINRELHSVDTYLLPREFAVLQERALETLAALEKTLAGLEQRQQQL